jgi:hypothetical protein
MTFEWIVSGVDAKGSGISQDDRATIRRQAMAKAANARRGKGTHVNRGQYPAFGDRQISTVPQKKASSDFDCVTHATAVEFASFLGMSFTDCPGQLSALLQQSKASAYFKHIATRYGKCTALDHAIQALAAKTRELQDP